MVAWIIKILGSWKVGAGLLAVIAALTLALGIQTLRLRLCHANEGVAVASAAAKTNAATIAALQARRDREGLADASLAATTAKIEKRTTERLRALKEENANASPEDRACADRPVPAAVLDILRHPTDP